MALFNTEKTCTPIEHMLLMEMYEEDNSYIYIGECDDSMVDNLVDDVKEPGLFDDEIVDPSELDDYDIYDDDDETYDGDDYFAFDLDDEDEIDALI